MGPWFRFPLVAIPFLVVVMGTVLIIGRDRPAALLAPLVFAVVLVGLLLHGGGMLDSWYARWCLLAGWNQRWLFHRVQRSLTSMAHDVSRVQRIMEDGDASRYEQALRTLTPRFVVRLNERQRRILARRLQRLLDTMTADGYPTEVPRIMAALGRLHACQPHHRQNDLA
jgi:hypothetical protein